MTTVVGLMIACPGDVDDDMRAHIEDLAVQAFHHRHPDAAYTGVSWVWCSETSYEDEHGERHQVPAHWGVYVEGEQ